MKKIIWTLCMVMPMSVRAQTSPKPSTSLVDFTKDAIKQAELISSFNLDGKEFGGAFVSIRSLDEPLIDFADVGAGAVFGAGHPDGLVAARINLARLSTVLFSLAFVPKNHGIILPDLFVGPAAKMSWPPNSWTWKKDAFLVIGIPFASMGL